MPRSTTLNSVVRTQQDAGAHKAAVFRKESTLQKVSPGFDECLRSNAPSSPSLYVLGRNKPNVSRVVLPTLTSYLENLDHYLPSNSPLLCADVGPERQDHHIWLSHRGKSVKIPES